MMRWCVALGLAVLVGAGTAAADTVEIVVDGSAGGWRMGSDQRPLADAIRRLLLDLSGRLAARATAPEVRLRWLGGPPVDGVDGCLAVDDVVALNPANLAGLAADLDERLPTGPRPLVRAIAAARAGGADRIVVLTTGPDSCGGLLSDLPPPAEGSPPIEVVALEVRPTSFGTLPEGFHARAVVLGASGQDALADAVLPDEGKGPRDAGLEVVTEGGGSFGEDATGTAVQTVSGQSFELFRRRDGRLVGRVPAGPYLVSVSFGDTTVEISDVVAASGAETHLAVGQPPRLDLEPDVDWRLGVVDAGSELAVRVWGDHERPVWLSLAPAASPVDMVAAAKVLLPGSRDTVLLVPDLSGPCELRAHAVDAAGHRVLAARLPLLVRPLQATVEAPERSEIGTALAVGFSGPDCPGDAVAVALADAPSVDAAACRPVPGDTGTLELTTPPQPGAYEVRYLSGLTGRIVARQPLEVFEILARLQVPAAVAGGSRFETGWEGPDAPGDFLTIVRPDAPDGEYRDLVPTASGNPVTLTAPTAPGAWEVRYVDGASAATFGRSPLEVTSVQPVLTAPETVAAGDRFEVRWSGPDAAGDFISIAPAGSPAHRHEDFAFTSLGSPASLAAPFRAGDYELRYVDGASGTVLAQRPLRVR